MGRASQLDLEDKIEQGLDLEQVNVQIRKSNNDKKKNCISRSKVSQDLKANPFFCYSHASIIFQITSKILIHNS